MTEAIVRAAEAEGERVLGVPVSAEGPVVDPVGTADALAGVPGWLLPQVAFLRDALEALRGDPAEINANVAKLRSAANDLEAEGLPLGVAIEGTAAMVVISGKLVHELRGIVFGMVCELATELTRNALIATAAAPYTNGGSIAVFCGVANARAAATAVRIRDRITTLVDALARQADRLGELEKLMQGLDFDPAPTQVALYANAPDPPRRVAVFRWSAADGVTMELLDQEWSRLARLYYEQGVDLHAERRMVLPSEGRTFMRALLQPFRMSYYTLRDESDAVTP